MREPLFNFSAPITDMTSYGLVALNVVDNSTCTTFPIRTHFSENFTSSKAFSKQIIEKIKNNHPFNPNIPSVRLYHQFSLAESIGRGRRIGWPIFELDTFNNIEMNHLNSVDHIIVCSEWAKGVLINNGIDLPSTIAPLGVNTNVFYPRSTVPNQPYSFFSCGKFEKRKGQEQIVEAFNLAFNDSDDVILYISMHNQFMDIDTLKSKKNEMLSTKLGSKIKFVGPFPTQDALSHFMGITSCGIFPSKAEGWGLETLEMMATGKPVIVSNYSAHTEYCNSNNSILIPVTRTELAYDGIWFHGQGNWGVINTSDIVDRMRYAYKNGIYENQHGLLTAQKFSWKNTVEKLTQSL